jgi:hypothetical protein
MTLAPVALFGTTSTLGMASRWHCRIPEREQVRCLTMIFTIGPCHFAANLCVLS